MSASASASKATAPAFVGQQLYFPLEIEIPNYEPNNKPVPELLLYFFSGWAVILGGGLMVAKRLNRKLGKFQLFAYCWFLLCGFVHTFFEGYYCLNVMTIAGKQDIFAQLWKEYSQSDSRYLTPDSFMHSMESLTALFWGPLSLFLTYAIVSKNSFRYPVQLIVSAGQLYGTLLYFNTAEFDLKVHGKSFTRPEPYYVYFYYYAMNILWIVMPLTFMIDSLCACRTAFVRLEAATLGKKKQ